MNKEVTQVADRPAELWIKVLGLVAILTLPLIGVIGSMIIDGQNKTNTALEKIFDTLNAYNAIHANHANRILRNEIDIKDIEDMMKSSSKRIYKLEGTKHGD